MTADNPSVLPTSDNNKTNKVSWLLGFLLLAWAGSSFYLWQKTLQLENNQSSQMNSLTENLNTQNNYLEKLRAENQNKLNEITEHQSENDTQLKTLLTRKLRDDNDEWRLLEAQHRVTLASMKVNFEHDSKTALELLRHADRNLQQVGGTAVHHAREALQQDMLALEQAATNGDRESFILKLTALSEQTAKLSPLTHQPWQTEPQNESEPLEENHEGKDWHYYWARGQQALHDSLTELNSVFRIQKRQQAIMPLLAAEDHALVVRNIQLLFTEAEIALLQDQKKLFRTKLQQIADWTALYFNEEDSAVKHYQKTLSKLQNSPLQAIQTNLNHSVDAMDNLLQQKVAHYLDQLHQQAKKADQRITG